MFLPNRITAKITALLTLAAVVSLIGVGSAFAAADAGRVMIFKGDCFKSAGGQRQVLKMGDMLQVGDVVEVPDGAKLKLRMNDGSVIALASGSRMTIKAYDVDGNGERRDAKLDLQTGVLRAVVAKVAQPSVFEVQTAVGVAAVRSTDWFVEAAPAGTRVSVLDGTVSLADATDSGPVLIPPGSVSAVAAKGRPTPPTVATKADFDRLIALTDIPAGWCQCTQDKSFIHAVCQPSPQSCGAYCGGIASFIPDARQSCGIYGDDVAARR